MPVIGPSKDFTNEQGDEITDYILKLIDVDYHIQRPNVILLLGEKFAAEWDIQEKKLREAIKELCWIDNCASF